MPLEDPVDRITISLYSIEMPDGNFNKALFQQKNNIKHIKDGFARAAQLCGRKAPEIIVSVLLIPNWQKGDNGYENKKYLELKAKFFLTLAAEFQDLGVIIQDFSANKNLTKDEKRFMHQQKSVANNYDLTKTRAIIDNRHSRHLQLDSNTKISDFLQLYRQTFRMPSEQQKDALMASCYSLHGYISPQNKIVYTTPQGSLAKVLAEKHDQYCKTYRDSAKHKNAKVYTLYRKVFAPALHDIGLTYYVNYKGLIVFPAKMHLSVYRITASLAGAINKSWSTNVQVAPELVELGNLAPIKLSDALCDFQAFSYVVKKLTMRFDFHDRCLEAEGNTKQQILKISNMQFDAKILVEFYNYVLNHHSQHVAALAKTIPDSIQGNKMALDLFYCKVEDLHRNPKQKAHLPLTFVPKVKLPYPSYLTVYGLKKKKVTGPRAAMTIEKIIKAEGQQVGMRVAKHLMFWAKNKKRHLKLASVKATVRKKTHKA